MYKFAKRIFDFLCAFIALIVLCPIFILTAIGIEISDFGPVFYKAKRIGKNGKIFRMYKFRSMRVPKNDTEKSEASFKADENRIFGFGKVIRKLKIDELPQLINILNGTMSIVGPRPASIDQAEIMRGDKMASLNTVVPGLTGPAALYDYIYGDTIEDLEEYKKLVLPTRIKLELCYPLHSGIVFDLKMIYYTVVCIVFSIFKKQPKKIYNKLLSMAENI